MAAASGEGDLTWESGDTWVSAEAFLTPQLTERAQTPPGLATVMREFKRPWEWEMRACLPFPLPFSVWQTPEMLVEIETAWSLSGYLLVCFSAGKSCPVGIK